MSSIKDCGKKFGTAIAGASLMLALSGCVTINTPEAQPSAGATEPSSQSPTTRPPSNPPVVPRTPTATATPSQGWDSLTASSRSGIAHIGTGHCEEGMSTGTGFLVDDDLVVTAAHVVDQASSLQVRVDDALHGAMVVGADPIIDIALLKLAKDSDGHIFELSDDAPNIGTEVGVLGFPLSLEVEDAVKSNNDLSLTTGKISSVNQGTPWSEAEVESILKTDAAMNSGNSGGPVLDTKGNVVGMAIAVQREGRGVSVEGTGFAVTSQRINRAVKQWEDRADFMPLQSCAGSDAPTGFVLTPEVSSEHEQAIYVAELFGAFGQGINSGNYEASFELMTPEMQERMGSVQDWAAGLSTTVWAYVDVYDIEGKDTLSVGVELWTVQEAAYAPAGTEQVCSIWDNQYTLKSDEIGWMIDSVKLNREPIECTRDMLEDKLRDQAPEFFG